MSTGFVLNIPQEMLNRLEDADNKIEKLAKTSEDAQIRIVNAFKSMTTNGVDAFIQRLDVAQQKLAQLGGTQINMGVNANTSGFQQLIDAINNLSQASKTNITINGLGTVGNQTQTAIDAINKLMATLQQLQQMGGQQFLGGVNNLGRQTLREMNKEAKKMQKTMQDLDDAIQKYGISATDLANKLQQARQAQQQFNDAAKQQAQADVSGLIGMKGQQTTLNELKNYANELKRTMANLDPKSQEWKKLNDIYKQTNREIKNIQNSMKDVQKQSRSLMDISGQLARRLALVFSVSQITGYVKKLIEVRGEFELQQRSLQAILQNKDEANRIWQQTVDLAVRSPFRVKELVSYTKQLAAYRIESDKLFETNKMLADISAGLGVDMQRLILALGQVRSAAYLRGTELRQFTEAGIPILEQLAQYFTELEGRAVSVGDVFERVSKRMVSFADVEEIFKRMTSEGGTFYRMQEIQAETLQGQISNLKDSVDIMLNEIGKAHQDTLASSVAFVRSIVQNWRLLATAIQQAGFALAGFSAVKIIRALRLTGDALEEATIKTKGLTAAIAKLKLAMKDLGKWIKAHPALFAVGLVASATHALIQYGKSVDAMNEKYDEMSQRELRRVDTLKELNEQAEKNNQAIKDAIAEQDNASEGTYEYATAEENLSRARGKNISLLERLKKEYPEVYASITKQEDGTVDLTKAIEEQNRVAQRQIALQQQAKGGWFQESLTKNYEDAVEALGNYQSSLDKVAVATYEMRQNLSMALSSEQITQEEYDAISSIADRMMDIKDSVEGLNLIEEIFGTKAMSNAEISALVEPIRHALVELGETVPEYNWALGDFFDNLENLKSLPVTINEMVALDPEKGKENAGDYVESVLDEFGIVNDTIREWAKRKIEKIIGFKLVWGDGEGGGEENELDGWAKRVKEAVDALNEEIKKKSPKIDTDDLFPVPNKNQTKEEYLAVAKDAIGVAEMTYDELQKIEDQEVVDRTKALSPFVETFRKILNLYKETKKGGGDKDTFTPMLRTVKEIYQEFKKLQGSFDDLTAKEGALAMFGDAFKEAFGKTPEQMGFDLFSEEGVKKAYDYLISKAPDAKKKIQAQLAKGEIVWDVKLQKKKDTDKELVDSVQELFDRYDLSLELKKLNIPPDLAKSLFDVDYLDLDGLKKAVQAQEAKFIGTDMEDEYKKFLEKIDDMEDKAAKERMKTYVKYLQEGMSERVKLKIEELRKLKEIEESDEFTPAQKERKERIKANVSKEARAEQQAQEWKDFQGSEMYTMMFEDLEFLGTKALDVLKNKLEELKGSLKDLPASEVKEIIGQISKIEDITIQRNPFTSLREAMKEVRELESKGRTEEVLQEELAAAELKRQSYQEELDAVTLILGAKENEIDLNQQSEEWQEKYAMYLRMQTSELEQQSMALSALVTGQGMVASNAAKDLKAYADARKALSAVSNEWGTIKSLAEKAYGSVKEVLESMGVESDSVAMSLADSAMNMVDLVFQAVMFDMQLKVMTAQAQLLGVAMNTALGPIGWIVLALQAVATLLSAILGARDKALQKTVEDNLATVERLQKTYEDLEESIDNAWDTASIQAYNKELKATTQSMIDAQKAAIAAQEKRKGANKEGSDAYNELQEMKAELDELEAQLDESLANSFSKVTDGILDSVHDAAREFTDAWWDAFVETGDGLKGLEENFNEMFLNLAKNQAAMQITGAFAERWKKDLEKYINANDTELTKDEAKKWAEEVRRTFPQLSDALEGYLGAFKDMAPAEGAGLSGLQKGIQGITSDQAEILTAYWNSVRGYTASIDSKMDLVLANLGAGAEENPMLEQIRMQTGYLRDIKDTLTWAATSEARALYVRLTKDSLPR